MIAGKFTSTTCNISSAIASKRPEELWVGMAKRGSRQMDVFGLQRSLTAKEVKNGVSAIYDTLADDHMVDGCSGAQRCKALSPA